MGAASMSVGVLAGPGGESVLYGSAALVALQPEGQVVCAILCVAGAADRGAMRPPRRMQRPVAKMTLPAGTTRPNATRCERTRWSG